MGWTNAPCDWLFAVSVEVTRNRLTAFWVKAVPREKLVTPVASCCEVTRASLASITPLLLTSRHTFTRVPASAVPVIEYVAALMVIGAVGLVIVGTRGALEPSVMAGTVVAADWLP